MSRQNYYRERRQRQRQAIDEELLIELVQKERKQHPRMGARKLLRNLGPELEGAGIQVGRDRFLTILRRHDLLVPRRPRRSWTTQSLHHFYKHPNRLQDCLITAAHEAWVSDLTYIRTEEGFLYLSLITDDFSRKIVGWEAADGLEAEGCLRALRKALEQLPEGRKPIHHSDRGIQYCCQDYTELLQSHGLTISMTENNHCYENAKAERVIGILKQEYALGSTFANKAQARQAIEQAIWLYNYRRPHVSLGYLRPDEVHRQAA